MPSTVPALRMLPATCALGLFLVCAAPGAQPPEQPAPSGESVNSIESLAAPEPSPTPAPGLAPTFLNRLLQGTWPHAAGLRVSGYLDQGFTWNPAYPRDHFNGPVAPNDRANEYVMNELYLSVARPVDTTRRELDLGFQIDLIYGTDGFFFQSFGLEDRWFSGPFDPPYQAAFPQFYADLFVPVGRGLTVRGGHFYTLMGYELQLQPDHFFYSYGYQAFYAIPFIHTGVHFFYPLTDQLTLSSGFNTGWQNFEDNNNALAYMGSLNWTSRSKKTQAYFALITGPEQDEPPDVYSGVVGLPGESLNRLQYTVYLRQQLSKKWEFLIHHDLGIQELSVTAPEPSADWYGIANYLIYRFSDRLAAGLRAEWFRDDDGTRVIGFRSRNAVAAGSFYELTLALNWRPKPNLIIKPELRWDWQHLDNAHDIPAFNDGTSTRQFLAALEVVLKF